MYTQVSEFGVGEIQSSLYTPDEYEALKKSMYAELDLLKALPIILSKPAVFFRISKAPPDISSSLLPIDTPLPVILGKDGWILILYIEHGFVGCRDDMAT